MMCVAAFCDLFDVIAADTVLLPLFGYAYQKGLARALYGEAPARRLCAALLFESFPAAATEFRLAMCSLGLPWPVADVEALSGLAATAA